jgi:asparagine synthase (glutamine-hydrolysing)
MAQDVQLGLPSDLLHYFDRCSMAASLEVRVPYLDHVFVDYCLSLPQRFKIAGRETKSLLRQAGRDLLPPDVVAAPKTAFFSRAVDGWVTARANRDIADYLRPASAAVRTFLQPHAVDAWLDRVETPDDRRNWFLVGLLFLEIWLSESVPRARRTPAPPLFVS